MKILKSLHSVTGTVIAVFFFMWFVTGLVLIYHPYPRLGEKETNHHSENIQADSLRPISYYTDSLTQDTITSVTVRQMQGQALVTSVRQTVQELSVQTPHSNERKSHSPVWNRLLRNGYMASPYG